MSGIAQGIFGGKKATSQQTSSSSDLAYPTINDQFGSTAAGTGAISTQMANMLGLNGSAGSTAGFDAFKNGTGFNEALDAGSQAITDNAAARGTLGSGATGKALETFGQNLASQNYNNYNNQLDAAGSLGLGAGNLEDSAGKVSSSQGTSNSSEKPGIARFLGQAATGVAGAGGAGG